MRGSLANEAGGGSVSISSAVWWTNAGFGGTDKLWALTSEVSHGLKGEMLAHTLSVFFGF